MPGYLALLLAIYGTTRAARSLTSGVGVEEGGEERDLGWGVNGWLGPRDAYAVMASAGARPWVVSTSSRMVPERRTITLHGAKGEGRCDVGEQQYWCDSANWRADGAAVAVRCDDAAWVVDGAGGCERVSDAQVGWLGERRVTLRKGVVSIDGAQVGDVGAEHAVLLAAGGAAFVSVLWPEWRVFRVGETGLEPEGGSRGAKAHRVADMACVFRSGHDRCWRADGSVVEADGWLVDPRHVMDEQGRVTGLDDGHNWVVPEANVWSARRNVGFSPPETVLWRKDDEIVRILPE